MKKTGKIICLIVGLFLVLSISVAAFMDTSVIYDFFTGKVAVHIEEYSLDDGTYTPWEDRFLIMPGEYISKNPVICNDGQPCYVRATVNFVSKKEASISLSMKDLQGISDDWVKIGEYFYYKNILDSREQVTFFEGFQIPKGWVSGVDDENQWELQVNADAVQADHLIPDFTSDDPWHMREEQYEIIDAPLEEPVGEEENNTSIEITVDSALGGFDVEVQHSFASLGKFMPGDKKQGTISLYNRNSQAQQIFMTTTAVEENELLSVMDVTLWWTVKGKEMLLYQGKGKDMDEVLTTYPLSLPGNATVEISVRLQLPKSADNSYASRQGAIQFSFFPQNVPVKTGDEVSLWPWIIVCGVSGGVLLTVIFFGRRRKHDM